MHNMITLEELLQDEDYKKYFLTVPKLPPHYRGRLMWKLMILKEGETQWRVKKFPSYTEAFKALKKLRPNIKDGLINSPGLDWQPPAKRFRVKGQYTRVGRRKVPMVRVVAWKPQIPADLPNHHWCPYCRRPTVFDYFDVHPAMTVQRVGRGLGANVDPSLLRCGICAASEQLINLRNPMAHQGWDMNRIKAS